MAEVWNSHRNFQTDRTSLYLLQSPQKIAELLYGEVGETRTAYQHFLEAVEHNGDIHKLLFELADVFIYTTSLAQQLKREDLAGHVLNHLQEGHAPVHTVLNAMALNEKMNLLTHQSFAVMDHIQKTPDQEMHPDDDIFTHSIVDIAATAGSIARDISPDIPFGKVVEAKIAYNNYRYPADVFSYPDAHNQFHYGNDIFNAYDIARRSMKTREGSLPLKPIDFLGQAMGISSKALSTAFGPTYPQETHLAQ